jgi:hypothetical protein
MTSKIFRREEKKGMTNREGKKDFSSSLGPSPQGREEKR